MDKPWYTSETIWGGVVMVVSFLLSFAGYTMTSEMGTEITNLLVTLATVIGQLIGIIMVIYGRVKAGRKITAYRSELIKLKGGKVQ